MNDQQFVEICLRVCRDALGRLPQDLRLRLKMDTKRRKDKKPESMLFSIRNRKRDGLWDPHYTTYALVHNPTKGSHGIWHCRFMHHKDREETGKGRFNAGIKRLLGYYRGERGFLLEGADGDKGAYNLTHPFDGAEAGLESKLARALTFLIGHLHPGIDKIIAEASGRDGRVRAKKPVRAANAPRRYWVVSPNVKNDPATVEAWCDASIRQRGAFMGWGPDDRGHGGIGPRFAGKVQPGIAPGDVILIARRYHHEPHLVGFGIVSGKPLTRVKNFELPAGQPFGSFWRLLPFVPWSRSPVGVPLEKALNHTKAMVQLHPAEKPAHREVCDWMDRRLRGGSTRPVTSIHSRSGRKKVGGSEALLVDLPGMHQLDFKVEKRAKIVSTQAEESKLLNAYQFWLKNQGRRLVAAKYGALRCDGYEAATKNLIEAKSHTRREYIRMAVGQLLDYAFMGRKKLGESNKAILLPDKPEVDVEQWLRTLNISVIWRDGSSFRDNANRRFT